MDFLQQQGIQVQVIPGITAAFGIAAELFPWTLRGVANSVRFLTGNSRIGGTDLLFIAKDAADPNSTLVIYMGLSNLPSLAKLPYHGLPLGTPAAAVEHETTPQQHVLVRDRDIATQEEGRRERRNEGPSRHVECNVVSRPRGLAVDHSMEVCWEKFARYFEVELKEVKLKEGYYVMDPVKAVEMIDENTICVAAILGPTLTGEFEDVKLLNDLLTKKNKETGRDTPIHVDAASGGLIALFLYPHLKWDFHLPLVKSIMKRFQRL